jgi:pimeloyl-ACP methyl ester carboxylesterase
MIHYNTYLNKQSNEWVTFIHGAGGSSNIWFKQLKYFKERYNVLLVDLRGHGKSKFPLYKKIKRYNFKIIRDDVLAVLDQLNIQQSHLVGISLGTIIIRDLAEQHPERVQSMILGGAVMKLNLRGQFLMRLGNLFKSMLPYMILYKLFAWVILPRKKHKVSRNIFVREAKKLDQKEFKKWFALVSEVNPLLRFFRIKSSKVPALYIMGEEDYMFLPSVKKLVQQQKNTELSVLPDCGHVVNIDSPELFNQQIVDFIEKLPRYNFESVKYQTALS